MRFMMLIMSDADAEAGVLPSAELVAAMTAYNEDLREAGVLLSLDGLQPTSKGARVSFADDGPTVTEGPFTGNCDIVAGYWVIQTGSRGEAIRWASRCPAGPGAVIEVRQVFEMADFPPELQEAAR